ncbi:MAG: alkaline protease, partial [Prevotella sp.]|nr:alkaline protease [Prevotella sp.]
MNKFVGFVLLVGAAMPVSAQRLLTLDSCRAMALRNNKQMGISKVKQEVAMNVRKSARTKYLPHVSALGTYQFTSKQLELLSDDQKSTLNNLGTSTVADLQSELNPIASSEPMQHIKA